MGDYKNGKIYQIVCNITGETYIGSTNRSLETRLGEHKNHHSTCCSKSIIERGNYYIELLETYPCESKSELARREGEYQRDIKCVNRCIAGRTFGEWYEDNKEQLALKQKQYILNHKEELKANKRKEVICECGIKYTHCHLQRHKRSKRHIDLMAELN